MAFAAVMLCMLFLMVGASRAAVIDTDSPSPASQRLAGADNSFSRPVETIEDLMNALAQVTKSKGKYSTTKQNKTRATEIYLILSCAWDLKTYEKQKKWRKTKTRNLNENIWNEPSKTIFGWGGVLWRQCVAHMCVPSRPYRLKVCATGHLVLCLCFGITHYVLACYSFQLSFSLSSSLSIRLSVRRFDNRIYRGQPLTPDFLFRRKDKYEMPTIFKYFSPLFFIWWRLDELRCHCNLPVCVTTGYMCKSAMGTCFSEIVDRNDLSRSRHGCLELLSR